MTLMLIAFSRDQNSALYQVKFEAFRARTLREPRRPPDYATKITAEWVMVNVSPSCSRLRIPLSAGLHKIESPRDMHGKDRG